MAERQDYNNWTKKRTDDGRFFKVNTATGECREGYKRVIYEGDAIITQEQQLAHQKYVKEQEKRKRRRTIGKELGNHFYIPGDQSFPGLSPQSVTRLIYLETYADYDNKLKISQRKDMHREDLPKVLGVSDDTARNFLSEVCPDYIEEKEDGLFFTNRDIFIRGKLKPGTSYRRMYIEGIRKLYTGVPKSKHKHLGYMFRLLPFINIEFNIACYNPNETDLDKVEHLTLDKFCEYIGFNKSNRHKLLKSYRDLHFTVGNHTERFCSIVCDGINLGSSKIFINPHILYSGSNYERVEILGEFCKE